MTKLLRKLVTKESIVKQKVSKSIGIIKHIRKNLPQTVLLTLYFLLVHSYFAYCNIGWGICRSAVFSSLFLFQKAIHVITNSIWN